MTRTPIPLKNPTKAAFLAWLVPGLGHLYQGRTGKGILYAVCILGLYFTGLILGEGKIVYWRWINPMNDPENFRASYLCQFFVGLPSLPGLIQATLHHLGLLGHGESILWGFLDAPSLNAERALQPKLSRLVEVGWVYTVIAGLLNILAIFDAHDGPALADEDVEPDAQPASAHAIEPQGVAS
ncbi:MAG: DUF6677 family protein [Isosphaeraceae bacterium]